MQAILLAMAIVLVVRIFLFSNYVVQGESMMPALNNSDHLIVNKINYDFTTPHYGDIIIFHVPGNENYVKRIIGLPGDAIVYKNDQLYRNGKKVPEPYLDRYKKDLLPGQKLTEDFTLKEKTGKEKVPKGELWVMGDNRQYSEDSRIIGCVKMSKVVGKVDLRYYPVNRLNVFK